MFIASFGFLACSKNEAPAASSATELKTAAATTESPAFAPAEAAPPATEPAAPRINASRAMQYVKEYVAIGSRPVGSPGHAKAEQYIKSKLAGDNVEIDSFTATTPAGNFPIHNIIAKFPGKKDGIIVIAGHYETNYPLPKEYVGANDGGSTTGLLLELANHLRGKQLDGYSVWLLWTDGEEAFVKWSDKDSLYGTKHLAQKWQQDGTAKKIKAFILLDMIGDADLDIQRDTNSTVWLSDLVFRQRARWDTSRTFFSRPFPSKTIIYPSQGSAYRLLTSSTSTTAMPTPITTLRRTRSTSSVHSRWRSPETWCWRQFS